MAGSYQAGNDALTRHAHTLAGLADELRAALDLASGVNITGDAYGQTAARFAAAVQGMASAGREALQAGVEALQSASTEMQATVATYQRPEDAGRARLAAIDGAQS
jgi:hypothetical protein